MKYSTRTVEKNEWDAFVKAQRFSLFVQSSAYANFEEAMAEHAFLFGVYDERNALVGGTLAATVHARRGAFLYLPYGPVFSSELEGTEKKEVFDSLTNTLKDVSKEMGLDFIRMSPFWQDDEANRSLIQGAGFRSSPLHILAEHTWLLPLEKDLNTILSEMNKNHRNLIRRCEKEGVAITMRTDDGAIDGLDTLLTETAKRHSFVRFSKKYIWEEFKALRDAGSAAIFEARLPDGRLDGAAMIVFFGDMACYRHSASLGLDKRLPTSYLLQWKVIEEAKKRGIKFYNFWGIAPKEAGKKHPFFGITHFKTGFGGYGLNLVHCHDLPLSKKYWLTYTIETVRKYKRGF